MLWGLGWICRLLSMRKKIFGRGWACRGSRGLGACVLCRRFRGHCGFGKRTMAGLVVKAMVVVVGGAVSWVGGGGDGYDANGDFGAIVREGKEVLAGVMRRDHIT